MSIWLRPLAAAALALTAAPSAAQDPPAAPALPPATVCGQQIVPRGQPPAGSGPVVLFIAPCFEAQGNASVIEAQTYLYYIQQKASVPSQGVWVAYDETSEKTIQDDFHRLWNTNFLDNLWIDAKDYTFPNGVIGKILTYNMEERQRVKIVDFQGSKKLETSKIEEKLKEGNAQIRLDTFIDPALIRKIEGIIRDMMKEKGFQAAEISHEIKPVEGGPKLVHVTFNMSEGPKVKIRKVDFTGNTAMSDSKLTKKLKTNKPKSSLSFLTGRGTYQETKFEEDAERVMEALLRAIPSRSRMSRPYILMLRAQRPEGMLVDLPREVRQGVRAQECYRAGRQKVVP